MRSLRRDARKSRPPTSRPQSPVRSQPPGYTTSAVASGICQYSRITIGERIHTSPSSPSASGGAAGSSGSRISIVTVGNGRPTLVGYASSSSPKFVVASAVHSVSP